MANLSYCTNAIVDLSHGGIQMLEWIFKMVNTAASLRFPCQNCEVRDKAICSALDETELRQLSKISTSVALEPDNVVFYEGDDSNYLFNVVSGAVRLSKLLPDGRRQITGFLFPGDFLGLSVADQYAYTAEALTETSLCRFNRNSLTKMVDAFPKLEHRLLQLASNELAQAQDHIMVLGRKTATERIATLLSKLAHRIGQKTEAGWQLEVPMSRMDIADYTGLTIETVSRLLTKLRKKGVIDTPQSRSFHIPNLEELIGLSGDQ